MQSFSSQIDVFLNEFNVSVKDQTYIEKILRIISELKDNTSDSNDNFEKNDFKNNNFKNDDFKNDHFENDDFENDDVEDNNVKDNNIEDNKIKDAKKDKILNYILQSLDKKTIVKFLWTLHRQNLFKFDLEI